MKRKWLLITFVDFTARGLSEVHRTTLQALKNLRILPGILACVPAVTETDSSQSDTLPYASGKPKSVKERSKTHKDRSWIELAVCPQLSR